MMMSLLYWVLFTLVAISFTGNHPVWALVIGEDIKTVQFGWPLGMPLVEKLERDIWEVRTDLGQRIARVLFTIHGELIVLLHGFIKKTQKTPPQDLAVARRRLRELRGGVQ